MMKFKVMEDNGGGLHLAVLNNDGACIYFGSGYEYRPDALAADLLALKSGDSTEGWEGDINPQGRYNWAMTAVSCRNGGMQVVADYDGEKTTWTKLLAFKQNRPFCGGPATNNRH